MRIHTFAASQGQYIQKYGSVGAVVSPILVDQNRWQVVCVHIEPEGILGAHAAAVDQLFLVVRGSGTVSSNSSAAIQVGPGTAIFWTKGENHETRAGSEGLVAIVIEGEGLSSANAMPASTGPS